MTTSNNKSAMTYSTNDFAPRALMVCSPSAEYNAGGNKPSATGDQGSDLDELPSMANLQDALENHLAQYHYHQAALLALVADPDGPESSEWEFGAHTLSRELQERSHELIRLLCQKTKHLA